MSVPEAPDVAVDALREMLKTAPPKQVVAVGVPTFWRVAALALAVVAVAEGGVIGWTLLGGGRGTGTAPGNVRLDSKPEGAQVKIDGQNKGVTPLATSLSPGPHVLELSTGGEPRVIPITVNAGETLGQYVELSGSPSLGRLLISSQPAGATILLDGQPRGTAPTELSDVSAGDHELVLELNGVRIRQAVSVAAGTVTTVGVPMKAGSIPAVAAAAAGDAAAAPVEPTTGGLRVNVPFEMQVFEGQTLVGVTGDRLVLSPGPHDLRLVSETLGFEKPLHAEIFAGKTTHLPLPVPKGTLSLNATPWAEVWIDGQKVGETPIGNLSLPVGPHEIVFKNPDLGEQHHAATVTATAPVRLSVDLSKPQQ